MLADTLFSLKDGREMLKMDARLHSSVARATNIFAESDDTGRIHGLGLGRGPRPSSLPGKNEDLSLDP